MRLGARIPAEALRSATVTASDAGELERLANAALALMAAAHPDGMVMGLALGGGGAAGAFSLQLTGTEGTSPGPFGAPWGGATVRCWQASDPLSAEEGFQRVRLEQEATPHAWCWQADVAIAGAGALGMYAQVWATELPAAPDQDAWFVNAATGDDANDGATEATAIRTLRELRRRLPDPIAIATTVTLSGDFSAEVFDFDLEVNALLEFRAETTVVHTGTIASVTATDPATLTRGAIVDAAAPFAGLDGARLRLTTGAFAGAVAYVTRVIAADEVNVSRWALSDPATTVLPTIGEPAPGDEYVIETLPTRLGRQQLLNRGGARLLVRDVVIASSDAHQVNNFAAAHQDIVYYGVSWGAPVAAFYRSDCVWLSCAAPTVVALAFTGHIAPRACLFSGARVQVSIQSSADFQRANCFDRCQLLVLGGSHVTVTGTAGTDGDTQFCDFVGGDLVVVGPGSVLEAANAGALMWGADNGTVNTSFRVFGGGGLYYVTTPTVPGAPAGQDCRVGGTFLAYAGLPFVEPANGGAMVIRV